MCYKLTQPLCSYCAGTHAPCDASVGDARSAAELAAERARGVRWLHIPKCGSTFGLTLLRHACPPPYTQPWHLAYMARARPHTQCTTLPLAVRLPSTVRC